jgi:hypothetical protein
MARLVGVASAACCWTLAAGCVTTGLTTSARLGASVSPRDLIVKSEANMGWGFLSHPFMYDLSPFGVVVSYNLGGDTSGPVVPDALREKGPAVTVDAGRTWALGSEGLAAFRAWPQDMPRYGQRTPRGIFCWTAPIPAGGLSKGISGWIEPDTNEIKGPWPMRIELPAGAQGGRISDCVVAHSDGRLLLVAYTSLPEDNRKHRVVLLASSDEGRNFEPVATVASPRETPWAPIGPTEPTIAEVEGGALICVMRSGAQADTGGRGGSGPMIVGRSEDGGKTWSLQKMTIPGVMPKLRRLEDGTLALAFGRPGNNLIFSMDEGRSWGGEVALTRPDEPTSGYLDFVEVSPGRLLVVFDTLNKPIEKIWLWDPKKVNAVWGAYVDVRRRW